MLPRLSSRVLETALTPATAVVVLLFGMLFALAGASYAGVRWSLAGTASVYGLGLVCSVAAFARRRPLHLVPVPMDFAFAAFIASILISVAVHGWRDGIAQPYFRYIPLIVLPYLAARMMRMRDVRQFLMMVVAAGLCLLPLLAIEAWRNQARHLVRPVLFGQDYSALPSSVLVSAALLTVVAALMGSRRDGDTRLRVLGMISIGALIIGLMFLAIRISLIATLAMVVAAMAVSPGQSPRFRLVVLGYVVTLAAVSVLLFSGLATFYSQLSSVVGLGAGPAALAAPDWLAELAQGNAAGTTPILGTASCEVVRAQRDSIAIRQQFYREAAAMFASSPVVGVGAGRFGLYSCLRTGHAHSTLMHVLAELGLVGGACFVGLIACGAWTLMRVFRRAGGTSRTVILALGMLFGFQLMVDQVQGNYFFSLPFYALAGALATIQAGVGSAADRRDALRSREAAPDAQHSAT